MLAPCVAAAALEDVAGAEVLEEVGEVPEEVCEVPEEVGEVPEEVGEVLVAAVAVLDKVTPYETKKKH